ncbi:MAG: hypothetical protein NTX05_00355 [Fusobacteria bacterium]|nr:hypothetical protein [Fusobacteriota bacterium]
MDELGHRKRLRDKFYTVGLSALLKYERLELLLTYSIPRKDCKRIAKELLKKFQSIHEVLYASPEALQAIDGVGLECVKFLKFIKGLYLEEFNRISPPLVLESSEVFEFLKSKCNFSNENFFVLMFSKNNQMIHHIVFEGEFKDSILIDVKKILKESLIMEAFSIIVAHNHMCEVNPSKEDSEFTSLLKAQLDLVGIKLLDHIIVTRDSQLSFRESKLL